MWYNTFILKYALDPIVIPTVDARFGQVENIS